MIGRFRSNATQLSQNISNTQLPLALPCKCNTRKAKLQPYYICRPFPPSSPNISTTSLTLETWRLTL